MKKILIILMASLFIFTGCRAEEESHGYYIIDKYEYDGKQFLLVEIEISAEEYIGYEIGDEYVK